MLTLPGAAPLLSGPMLSATLIVRDEAPRLRRCLDSIRHFVDEIVVVDTGSVDETPDIAASYGARVLRSPWRDDFSFHRKEALDAATGRWTFVIDGDEELEQGWSLRSTVAQLDAAGGADSVVVQVQAVGDRGPSEEFHAIRAFRREVGRYKYPVHNQLIGPEKPALSKARVRSYYVGTLADKVDRSLPLLRRMLDEDPQSAHAAFFLCKTLWASGRMGECIEAGGRAAELVGSAPGYASLWVWLFYAAMAVDGPVAAERWLAEGLERHPWYPELLHTRIVADLLRWNASMSDPVRYAFASQVSSRFVRNLPQVARLLGVPLEFTASAEPEMEMTSTADEGARG